MRSLTGATAIRTRLLALLLVTLPGFCGSALAARCADPAAPFRIAQQQMLGNMQLRALESNDPAKLPRLAFLNGACHLVVSTVFGRPDPEAQGSDKPQHLLRFRTLTVAGMPDPVVLAVMASPGASDTEFETQIFARQGDGFRPLLARAAITPIEGGVFLGDLGTDLGPGFAAWHMAWRAGESHADPHRYTLLRWRWTGQGLASLPAVTTAKTYGNPEAALRELGVGYHDMTRDFADFAPYR
jgi:hypothetical protein